MIRRSLLLLALVPLLSGAGCPFLGPTPGFDTGYAYVLIRDNGGPRMDTPSSTASDGIDLGGLRAVRWDDDSHVYPIT